MALFSKNNIPKYLLYKPRLTLYEVVSSCKIKDHQNSTWLDGLAYRQVEGDKQLYSRALQSFETDKDKWEVFYS